MKYLILMIALGSIQSFSLELEIGVGVSQHDKPPNGLWYQEEFDHKINNTSPTFNIGVKHKNWTLGYKYLGKFSSTALASASDENYLNWQQGTEEIWPLSTFNGKGKVDGIYLNYRHYVGNFFVVGGVWYHRVKWKVSIPDWIPSREAEPLLLEVSENVKGVKFTYGLGYTRKRWSISYEIWDVKTGSTFPATFGGDTQNLNISYAF